MALPREPRQKMINMMYLVLTALLALNVSSEILNAFKTVNSSLEKTNNVINSSTDEVMKSLKDKLTDAGSAQKAEYWYPKAEQAQKLSENLYKEIQNLKDRILKEADGDPNNPSKRYKEDNLDIATRIMIDKKEGPKLLAALTAYRTQVLALDPLIKEKFDATLPINLEKPSSENKAGRTWEGAYFHMVPTVAALTILSKFQNDVRSSENNVVTFCHEQVGKVVLRNDAFAAIAVADANYILPGQEIQVTAGVGGFSTAVGPEISINGQSVKVGTDGTAVLKVTGGGIGNHSIPVHIVYTDQDGKRIPVDKTIEYTVGQSNAAVQLDKMNVLFIGVDNPVTVSGSGSADQLKTSMEGAGPGASFVSTGGGHFIAKVTQETDNCLIKVTTPDGKTTAVPFRIRSIPDPTPRVGNYESGDIPAGVFVSQAGVNAIVKNFYYQTQFTVTGFRITGDGTGFDNVEEAVNTGAAWSEALKIVRKCKPGSYITIEDIRAIGPDNRTRKLNPLIFQLR